MGVSWRIWGAFNSVTPVSLQEVALEQGSPTPGPQTGTGPRPVRNRAAQQEVSGGQASEASSAAPHRSPSPPEPPTPPPGAWKNCVPQNRSLVPKRLGTAGLEARTGMSGLNAACFAPHFHLHLGTAQVLPAWLVKSSVQMFQKPLMLQIAPQT